MFIELISILLVLAVMLILVPILLLVVLIGHIHGLVFFILGLILYFGHVRFGLAAEMRTVMRQVIRDTDLAYQMSRDLLFRHTGNDAFQLSNLVLQSRDDIRQ
jgi:hypothetical protein